MKQEDLDIKNISLSQVNYTNALASEILDEFYEKNIIQELMCYRKGIEDLYFIYSTFLLERLLTQFDDANKKNNMSKQAALDEMNQFTLYLVKHKTRYMNNYLQDEMVRLQKNRCSLEYLKKLSSSYKYWIINTNERLQGKIQKINQSFLKKYGFLAELYKKFKQEREQNITPEINRFGVFTEQGQLAKRSKINKEIKRECTEQLMIEQQIYGSVFWIDTFPQDSTLEVIAQIERVQKGVFEQINFDQRKSAEHDDLMQYSRCPFQAAKLLKPLIQKYYGSQEENKRNESIQDDNQDNYQNQNRKITYCDIAQFKLSHDRTLLEALISECYTTEHCQQPTLIQGCLNDQAKQICCVEVGKFANVLACGCLDGIIYIYELTKHFLLPGSQKKHKEEGNGINLEQNKMETEKIQEKLNFQVSFELNQHEGPITALSLIYDEYNLLSGSVDQSIKLWCLRTRQLLLIYKGHLSTIWCIKWAPAGYWFASGSQDKTTILWQTDHLQPQKLFVPPSPSPVSLVEFSPSGKYLFTGDELNTLRTWDIETCTCIAILNLPSQPISISISLSGMYLAVGCLDGQAHLYFAPIQPMKLISNNIYLDQKSQDPYQKGGKKLPVSSISISYDESLISCQNGQKTAFFSIGTLSKPINEDVIQGQYIGQQIEILSKKHPKLTKQTIQAIEILDNQLEQKILYLKMIPQGYCLQIVR